MKFTCRFEFKPQDIWVGVYWKRTTEQWVAAETSEGFMIPNKREVLDVWVCLIPMIPLHLRWFWGDRQMTEEEYLSDVEFD